MQVIGKCLKIHFLNKSLFNQDFYILRRIAFQMHIYFMV